MSKPVLRHVANLWTLVEHPSKENEWPLDQKLRAIKEAGFDGVCWGVIPHLKEGLERHGLDRLGISEQFWPGSPNRRDSRRLGLLNLP